MTIIGEWLQQQSVSVQCLISSPATRAMQTVEGIAPYLQYPAADIVWENAIYAASCETLLAILNQYLSRYNSLLLIGHNPGLEDVLSYVLPDSELALQGYQKLFPTAALAQLDVPAQLTPSCAQLINLVRPRGLANARNG